MATRLSRKTDRHLSGGSSYQSTSHEDYETRSRGLSVLRESYTSESSDSSTSSDGRKKLRHRLSQAFAMKRMGNTSSPSSSRRNSDNLEVASVSTASSSSANSLFEPENMQHIMQLPVLDKEGQPHSFKSILRHSGKTVVIFIRYYYCGLCMQYVDQMKRLPFERIEGRSTKVVLIGCGHPDLIEPYSKSIGLSNELGIRIESYTDPTRRLHQALELDTSMSMGHDRDKGDYVVKSTLDMVVDSTMHGLKMPLLKNPGRPDQLGGEFLFEVTKERELLCTYANRMTNTRNHGPLKAVFHAAGLDIRQAKSVLDEA